MLEPFFISFSMIYVVGRGRVSLLTNLDTWHSEPFTDTWSTDLAVRALGPRGDDAVHLPVGHEVRVAGDDLGPGEAAGEADGARGLKTI